MVWVGRDIKDHLVQTSCQGEGHLSLDQATQSNFLKPAKVPVDGILQVYQLRHSGWCHLQIC